MTFEIHKGLRVAESIERHLDEEFLERYHRLVPAHDHATNTWRDDVRTGANEPKEKHAAS